VSLSVNHYSKSQQFQDFDGDLNKFVIFKVEDTGRGIEPERLSGIFERFKSADINLAVSNMQSTGIGLSYIKELIEFHQGKIFVESEVNTRTTFTILIPKDLKPSKLQPHQNGQPEFDLNKSLDASLMNSEHTVEPINGHSREEKSDTEKHS